jgi:hypothetical protein
MLLTTHHVKGVNFMPIHDGMIAPYDIPYLNSTAALLKEHMVAKNEFRFPTFKCNEYGDGLISCWGGETNADGGARLKSLTLVTKKITTEVFDTKVKSIKVALGVRIEGFVPVQEITMEYAPEDCQFGR